MQLVTQSMSRRVRRGGEEGARRKRLDIELKEPRWSRGTCQGQSPTTHLVLIDKHLSRPIFMV